MLASLASVASARLSGVPANVDSGLAKKLAGASPKQNFDVIVKLKQVKVNPRSPGALKTLKSKTRTSQKSILASIRTEKAHGKVKSYRSFWITNAVVVRADADTIKTLAANPSVEKVFPNFKVSKAEPVPTPGSQLQKAASSVSPSTGSQWNVEKVGAPEAWSGFGVTGDGAKVAVLDTGIDPDHPDLEGKIGSFVEVDEFGVVTTTSPKDTDEHGTHVSGTIAGGNASGSDIGVAPGVELMGAIVIPFGWGTFAQVMGGMEWAADPDGNPVTADQPDAINLSVGGMNGIPMYFEPVDNLIAAGVFPAIAVGNWGPDWVSGPADVPGAFAVGATDSDDDVAWFSSGGLVTWYDEPHEGTFMKPEASAPGVAVKSSIPGGTYATWSGTSMATPHVAAAAALLRSYDPTLTVAEVAGLLEATALDLGDTGQDTRYGFGRIDIEAAMDLAGAFGSVEGTVTTPGNTDDPARVRVIASPGGTVDAVVSTGSYGRYQAVVPTGNHVIEVSKYGYTTVTSDVVSVLNGGAHAFSPTLSVAPNHTLSGTVTKASNGTPLEATIDIVSPTTASTYADDGAFSFDVPDGTYVLQATRYGYKSQEITVDVSSGDATGSFALEPVSPALLVLDVDADRYGSYFRTAMSGAGMTYDVVTLDSNFESDGECSYICADILTQYDKVVWAAGDGPATGIWDDYIYTNGNYKYVQAPLGEYLDGGGKLIITGQDVAYYDWGWWDWSQGKMAQLGIGDKPEVKPAFTRTYLHARYLSDKAKNLKLAGKTGGLFEGTTMDLLSMGTTEDGANNQIWPDVITPDSTSHAELAYTKEVTDSAAAVRTSSGEKGDARVVYFSFGIEALDNAADRQSTISKADDWLDAPPGTLTASVPDPTLKGPKTVTLGGRLNPHLAGEKVTVEKRYFRWRWNSTTRRYTKVGYWRAHKTATTTSGGYWSAKVSVSSRTNFRAVWNGDVDYGRTVSKWETVVVSPIFEVYRRGSGAVEVGERSILTGYLNPFGYGEATVYRRTQGSTDWHRVGHTWVWGYMYYMIQPTENSFYRVEFEGSEDGSLRPSTSDQVKVLTKKSVSIEAETNLVPSGVKIYFEGRVAPAKKGEHITLQRAGSDGVWRDMKTIELGSSASWSTTFLTFLEGKFKFRAVYDGDSLHGKGISNEVKVRFY